MQWVWGALGFLGLAVVGMLLGELHESASILGRFIVRRAARKLVEPMRSIREEEWLAELEAMPGLHLIRLLWALHTLPAAWRSPSRRPRRARRDQIRLPPRRTDVEARKELARALAEVRNEIEQRTTDLNGRRPNGRPRLVQAKNDHRHRA